MHSFIHIIACLWIFGVKEMICGEFHLFWGVWWPEISDMPPTLFLVGSLFASPQMASPITCFMPYALLVCHSVHFFAFGVGYGQLFWMRSLLAQARCADPSQPPIVSYLTCFMPYVHFIMGSVFQCVLLWLWGGSWAEIVGAPRPCPCRGPFTYTLK